MKRSPIKPKPEKHCKECGKPFTARLTTDRYCSYSCTLKNTETSAFRKSTKKIAQVSKKQAKANYRYLAARKAFLLRPENSHCAVYPKLQATEVHHKMGRVGYADQWARENDVPLLIDDRYFLAVSRKGHRLIEENPQLAYDKGWAKKRTPR